MTQPEELLFTADGSPIAPRTLRTSAVEGLLSLLVHNTRSAREIGGRVAALAFVVGKFPGCHSQKQLAAFLGVSPARVCVAIKQLRELLRTVEAGGGGAVNSES